MRLPELHDIVGNILKTMTWFNSAASGLVLIAIFGSLKKAT